MNNTMWYPKYHKPEIEATIDREEAEIVSFFNIQKMELNPFLYRLEFVVRELYHVMKNVHQLVIVEL